MYGPEGNKKRSGGRGVSNLQTRGRNVACFEVRGTRNKREGIFDNMFWSIEPAIEVSEDS